MIHSSGDNRTIHEITRTRDSFMKRLFRSIRAQSLWLSLVVPLLFLSILGASDHLFPSLFCAAVNPGGKEFVCGADYTHFGFRIFRYLGFSAWVLLLALGTGELFRGKGFRPVMIAWAVSAFLLISLLVLVLTLPIGDPP